MPEEKFFRRKAVRTNSGCLALRKMTASQGKSPEAKPRFKQIGFRLSILEENLPVKSGADKPR
jgi:hypothetical protein